LNPGLLGLQVNVPAQEGECCLFMPWHTMHVMANCCLRMMCA
jgi:hypothetical protein